MELVGITEEEFSNFIYNTCPMNMSPAKYRMRICSEAVRVHKNDIEAVRRDYPDYKPDPDDLPVIDPVVLLSFIYRPGWEKVWKLTPLERLTKLSEVQGGRFAECARRDLERMNESASRHESSRDAPQLTHRDAVRKPVTQATVTHRDGAATSTVTGVTERKG